MFKAEIKVSDKVTNEASFLTEAECQAWIVENTDYFPEGFVSEIVDVTAIQAQKAVNSFHRKYLADTDWYVIRFMETQVPVPQEILEARAAARSMIS